MLRIAVVDDDRGIRDALTGVIESIGHAPRCFASAEEFLASPERQNVACIILDVGMPGMNGLDLQDTLNCETRRPPTIFMTSHADEWTRRRALCGGAECFLGKPVESTQLIRCIQNALSRAAAIPTYDCERRGRDPISRDQPRDSE